MEKFAEMYFGFSGAAEVLIGYHYFKRISGKKSPIKLAASALIVVTVLQLCFGMVNVLKMHSKQRKCRILRHFLSF